MELWCDSGPPNLAEQGSHFPPDLLTVNSAGLASNHVSRKTGGNGDERFPSGRHTGPIEAAVYAGKKPLVIHDSSVGSTQSDEWGPF